MTIKIEFTCDECGNTSFVGRYDDEGDYLVECLACEEVEVIIDGKTNVEIRRKK